MFKRIRANFLTGFLVLIPLIVTFWLFYFVIDKFNRMLLEPIATFLYHWLPPENVDVLIKAAIFFVLIVLVILIGFATRILILRNVFGFGEKILYKVPMINIVYRTIKEISFAFFIQKDTIFKRVVLVEYPRKGIFQFGFVIGETKGEVRERIGKEFLNVFIPTTPNPTSGILTLVPAEETIPMRMSVAEGMKIVISGGAVNPKNYYGDTENSRTAFKKEGPEGN
ncbi:MAG: DUF502 domain-containing protein [Candidatus Omnitrophota bacterium]